MPIKRYKPKTPSLRSIVRIDKSHLADKPGGGSLVKGKKKNSGRNNLGRITTRHRGGGNKNKYRMIDFRRKKKDVPAKVVQIEYDPNRTAFIALICYLDGEKSYILAPVGLEPGAMVVSAEKAPNRAGNAMPLSAIRTGSFIHSVELRPGQGGLLARSAGSFAILKNKEGGWGFIELPSGELRKIPLKCYATIGRLSNVEHNLEKWGNAGRKRHKGWRPTVRGMIMNPCDHPNGGGEGKQKGKTLRTPWGKVARGPKTRTSRPSDKHILRSRRKK